MKVREQPVYGAKRVRRVDEERGLSGSRANRAPRVGARLERAHDGRSDRPDSASRLSSAVDGRRRLRAHRVRLGVQRVAGEVVHLDRFEGTGADVQVQRRDRRPARPHSIHQLRREMQPGGGCGDAAVVCGVHRLVAGAVLRDGRPADIRRQRRLTVLRERRSGIERANELHAPQPAAQHLDDLRRAVVAEADRAAGLELAAGMAHREPAPVGQLAHHQKLRHVPRFPFPVQSRRNYPRHVEDEHILGRDELDDVAKLGVPDGAGRAVEHQQAAGRAVGEGVLGDPSRWQAVIEV